MTFNIRHGLGLDRRVNLRRVARVIRDARAGVVGLQEVDRHYDARSGFVDQAGWLAAALGMQVAYGPALDVEPPAPGSPRRQYGNAVLSAYQILDSDNVLLPRGEREQRALLSVRVDAGGTDWQIYTTHLEPHDAEERRRQATAVAELVGTPTGPTVLLADLNATPGSAEVSALLAELADACAEVRCGLTFPNPVPLRRIDWVMCWPELTVTAAGVPRNLRARIASDHRPVLATLLPPPR
jgi:endonuclease/exonuclease/phosphatase family metal-dependent hydrolase